MPFVHIKIAGPALTAGQTEALQRGATALMADTMHKKAELTAVLVEQTAPGGWSVGARAVAAAAHIDVMVTAGTNSAEDKSRFIDQGMRLLKSVLGERALPIATYVVIHDIAADAWGYDGRTQEARRVKPDQPMQAA